MSTLHVENLKGLSSGGNANTIIVPSGQKLHATGHVLQVQETSDLSSGSIQVSSSNYTATGIICSITPQRDDSIILIDWFANMSDHATNHGFGRMYLKVGSGSYAAMAGSGDYTAGYKNSSYNRYGPIGMSGKYQVTSTDTLSFQPYYLSSSSTLTVVHNTSSYCLRLTEIAQ